MMPAARPDLSLAPPLPHPGLFPMFEQPDGFGLMPNGLAIRGGADVNLELRLTIVRNLERSSYGVLETTLDIEYDLAAALDIARTIRPAATVSALPWESATLWLAVTRIEGDWVEAVALTPSGPGTGRVMSRLEVADAEFLAALLEGPAEALGALQAQAVAVVRGVAPRAETAAAIDVGGLATTLTELAMSGAVDAGALRARVRDRPDWIKLDPVPTSSQLDQVSAAIADRVVARFTTWDPLWPGPPRGAFRMADGVPTSGTITWDLRDAVVVSCPVTVDFDRVAFAAAVQGVADRSSLVVRVAGTEADLGRRHFRAYSRLPRPRAGVLALGIRVRAPARLPFRPVDVVRAADLSPDDQADVVMDIGAPGAAADGGHVLVLGYGVLAAADGAHHIDGPERQLDGDWVVLGPDDFDLNFAVLDAAPSLLAVATVHAHVDRPGFDPVDVILNTTVPLMAVTAPRALVGAPTATVTIELHDLGGPAVIALRAQPLDDVYLDLSSLPTFGAQRIQVSADFGADDELVLVDLVPDGVDPSQSAVVRLTPAQPAKHWTYLASSPFHAGYRYRLHAAPGQAVAAWSDVRPAGEPLAIAATPRAGVVQ